MNEQQIAARSATKKNNKLRAELPLFAQDESVLSQWLTSVDVERERRERQRIVGDQMMCNRIAGEIDANARALSYREIVRPRVTPAQYGGMAGYFERVFGHLESSRGTNLAEYWWRKLVEIAPDVAPKMCPNKILHDYPGCLHDGVCITCNGKFMEKS